MDNDINWEFRDIKRELSEIKNILNKNNQSHELTARYENEVKCQWIACANNINGLCGCEEVKLKNVTINGSNYLNCNSFDFE